MLDSYAVLLVYLGMEKRNKTMNSNLNEYITNEFPSPEYDRNFINDLVNNYSGDINPNGDLLDNMGLFNYIWECLVAIEHPGTESVDLDDLVSDVNEGAEKDKKYKVVLAPSFPEEYRSVFEEILEDWEEDKINEKK